MFYVTPVAQAVIHQPCGLSRFASVKFATAALLAGLVVLGGCSTLSESDKVDYKSKGKQGNALEVPPDLTQLIRDNRFTVPKDGAANASSYGPAVGNTVSNTVSNTAVGGVSNSATPQMLQLSSGDAKLERAGSQRWITVARPPEVLWKDLKIFWQENGFELEMNNPSLGLLETNWAENRAKLPQDWFRKTIGSVLGSLYSTNELDKFRTRIDRTPAGGSEIYITHRGMAEDFVSSAKDRLAWKSRPSDAELENEFLKRLMIRLGTPAEQAKSMLESQVSAGAGVRLSKAGSQTVLLLSDTSDSAWRRVAAAMDRTGFVVQDRDRNKGLYFVTYQEPTGKAQPGLLTRIFGSNKAAAPIAYQIQIKALGDGVQISVLNDKGAAAPNEAADKLLLSLADDLKR